MDAAVVYWATDNFNKFMEIRFFIKQRLSERNTAYREMFYDK